MKYDWPLHVQPFDKTWLKLKYKGKKSKGLVVTELTCRGLKYLKKPKKKVIN